MKEKIIVAFEGLPGGGKTTLAEMSAMKFNGSYIPEVVDTGRYIPSQDEYYVDSEIQKDILARESNNRFSFLDRSYISMLAYNYGKKENGLENIYDFLLERFKDMGEIDLYIYLRIRDVGLCNTRKGIDGRNSVWTDKNNLIRIRDFYEENLSIRKNCVTISAETSTLDENFNLIVKYIQEHYEK